MNSAFFNRLAKIRITLITIILTLIIFNVGILTSRSIQAAPYDPKLKWFTLTTEHFNIHYHEAEEELAQRIAIIAEQSHVELSERFLWKPWGRTEVVLTDTVDITNGFATVLPYNLIILYLALPQGNTTLNYYDDWLRALFFHEYTHIVHVDMYGGITKPFRWVFGKLVSPNGLTPGWVREGIAVQQESLGGKGRVNNSFTDMMLRTDILNHQFLKLDQMAGLQFEWPGYNAGYLYGGSFWDYLADTYGAEKITEFSHRYSNSMWLFSLNNKARKTFGKTFYKLHQDWKKSLEEKYQKEKVELEAQGLSPLHELKHIQGNLENPTLSPDGSYIYYSQNDYHNKPEIRRMRLDGSEDIRVTNERVGDQYSLSADGKKLAFHNIATFKRSYQYFDLFELDLENKKIAQLTQGARAFHPDYSPDGKTIVFVSNQSGGTQLELLHLEDKKITALTQEKSVQFSNPRFSMDGKFIAVSKDEKGQRDIYFYNLNGKTIKKITDDQAVDLNPSFSRDGKSLFFSSDKSGITNVYRYDLGSGKTDAVTNVLTGVFNPQYAQGKLIVQHYYGRGFDVQSMDLPEGNFAHSTEVSKPSKQESLDANDPLSAAVSKPSKTPVHPETLPSLSQTQNEETPLRYSPKKYNPFKKLFIPRYVLPGIYFGDSILLTADIGSSDPLGRHSWTGGINYRTDANFLGGQFLYSYNRFDPSLFFNFYDFAVSYGDVFGIGENFFEERRRFTLGSSYTKGRHSFAGYYFFENRSAESKIPDGVIVPPTLGNFSGFGLRYNYARVNKYPASISLEGGPRLSMNFEVTDSALGSSQSNEQVIFSGDLREYVPLPLEGHVLAFRLAGGIAWGDQLLQGTFRLGSALGEGTLNNITPRLFTLRGLPQITFAGERALLMSGEYRLPLIYPQRGLGTMPIHLNKLYMVFFADYGTVFNGDIDFNNFLLGVGTELRGDFMIGYGLPITGRLGYGIIVSGREFIQGLKDPITQTDIKNGTLILQLGTSF